MSSIRVSDLQTLTQAALSWSLRHDKRDYEVVLVPSGLLIKGTDRSLPSARDPKGFIIVQDTRSRGKMPPRQCPPRTSWKSSRPWTQSSNDM